MSIPVSTIPAVIGEGGCDAVLEATYGIVGEVEF